MEQPAASTPGYLEDSDFTQCCLADLLILVRLFELFDGHNLTRLLVARFQYNAISAVVAVNATQGLACEHACSGQRKSSKVGSAPFANRVQNVVVVHD